MLTAFSMWTATTVLFGQSGYVAAARGMFVTLHVRWYKLMIDRSSSNSYRAAHFDILFVYNFEYTSMLVLYTLEILLHNICGKC